MFHFALDGVDARDLEGAALPNRGGRRLGDNAQFCLRVTGVRLDLNPNFKFVSNLNYIDSYFTEGVEKGNETPYVPRLSGNSSIHYNFDKQTNFSFDYKYIGKKRSGNDPNYILSKSKSYQLVDFNINYKTKNFTVKGSINNLLDKKYYTNLIKSWDNKAYVYPQPGRTLFLGLEAKF